MIGRLRFAYGVASGLSLALAVSRYGTGSVDLAAINLAVAIVTALLGFGDRTSKEKGVA